MLTQLFYSKTLGHCILKRIVSWNASKWFTIGLGLRGAPPERSNLLTSTSLLELGNSNSNKNWGTGRNKRKKWLMILLILKFD